MTVCLYESFYGKGNHPCGSSDCQKVNQEFTFPLLFFLLEIKTSLLYNIKPVVKQFQKGFVDMPCLTVRDLPPRTLSSLKTRAKSNHRSLNGEILFIFDWIVDHDMKTPPPVTGMSDPVVTRQKSEMESLIGSWSDKRATDEIIDDIYAARSPGREVAL